MDDFFYQGQIQTQKQTQVQVMSQQQIHALKILSMDTAELIDEISNAVKDNPVLQIDEKIRDDFYSKKEFQNKPNISGDSFQSMMESKEDTRETLTQHLLHQLNMEQLSPEEFSVGEKLIYNLDQHGHHLLEPTTLLDKTNPAETVSVLNKCISMIQSFDPVGVCTKNIEESLLVQAKENPYADEISVFILDGHLDFINPPIASKAAKKIKQYQEERKKLFGLSEKEKKYLEYDVNEESVQLSIDFIKKLTPFPASGFSTDDVHLVSPDIFVSEVPLEQINFDSQNEKLLEARSILKINGRFWKIQIHNSYIPKISIDPEVKNLCEEKKELKDKIKSAQDFIEMLNNRTTTIEKSAWEIVKIQHEFFEKGRGHLSPLRLKDLAEKVGVSESTISRMANGKYLQFNGLLYPVKYFFENSVGPAKKSQSEENSSLSRDNVQFEIQKILEEHKNDSKKLSDQKISDILEQRGIKVARRTVAKYRSQLNIESSYDR